MLWDLGIVREIVPGFGLSVSFAQRNVYKELWTDNLALNCQRLHSSERA